MINYLNLGRLMIRLMTGYLRQNTIQQYNNKIYTLMEDDAYATLHFLSSATFCMSEISFLSFSSTIRVCIKCTLATDTNEYEYVRAYEFCSLRGINSANEPMSCQEKLLGAVLGGSAPAGRSAAAVAQMYHVPRYFKHGLAASRVIRRTLTHRAEEIHQTRHVGIGPHALAQLSSRVSKGHWSKQS